MDIRLITFGEKIDNFSLASYPRIFDQIDRKEGWSAPHAGARAEAGRALAEGPVEGTYVRISLDYPYFLPQRCCSLRLSNAKRYTVIQRNPENHLPVHSACWD